jgi:hypothetical protein
MNPESLTRYATNDSGARQTPFSEEEMKIVELTVCATLIEYVARAAERRGDANNAALMRQTMLSPPMRQAIRVWDETCGSFEVLINATGRLS